MTVEEQVKEEEILLDDISTSFDEEENTLFKAILEAILIKSLTYDLSLYKNRLIFLKYVKNEFIKLNKKLYGMYNKEYDIKSTEKILGYTVKELVNSLSSKKYLDIKKTVKVKNKLTKEDLNIIFKDKYKKEAIKQTVDKYIREKEKSKETSNYGWVSSAVLDKRTSHICSSLNGKFYSSKDYPTRGSIPNLPPRHFRCRSVIIEAGSRSEMNEAKNI